jgi:putative hydrolase of the HAD superfamily
LTKIKAVVFDLDDTLYFEPDYVISGFKAVAQYIAERHGLDEQKVLTDLMEILQREGRGRVFDHWIEGERLQDLLTPPELVTVYWAHAPTISFYPDVEPTLKRLRAKGILLGIITDGNLLAQTNKVQALGVEDMVDLVICTDVRGHTYWKPNPQVFIDALGSLNVRPTESVYVGNDPRKDFSGPEQIGMWAVHIERSPIGEHSCEADFHITGLDQIDEAIRFFDTKLEQIDAD